MKNKLYRVFSSTGAQVFSFCFILAGTNGIVLPFLFWLLGSLILNPLSKYTIFPLYELFCLILVYATDIKEINLKFSMAIRAFATINLFAITSYLLYKNTVNKYGGYTFSELIPFLSFLFFVFVNTLALFKIYNFYKEGK